MRWAAFSQDLANAGREGRDFGENKRAQERDRQTSEFYFNGLKP